MQMGYDFESGPHSADPAHEFGQVPGFMPGWADATPLPPEARHPEWAGLRARFMAIHALRHELGTNADSLLPGGNFVSAGEAVLAASRQHPAAVNLTCSANGKVVSAILPSVADFPTPGDRGMQ